MTKSEALQNLAAYNPAYYINFDYSIFTIPYSDLLSDNLLGENKQLFYTLRLEERPLLIGLLFNISG